MASLKKLRKEYKEVKKKRDACLLKTTKYYQLSLKLIDLTQKIKVIDRQTSSHYGRL